jgi:hypothetical protein
VYSRYTTLKIVRRNLRLTILRVLVGINWGREGKFYFLRGTKTIGDTFAVKFYLNKKVWSFL